MGSYLDNDIKFLKGVGEQRAKALQSELGITTMRDLLYYFPFRYIDRTKVYKIAEVRDDSLTYIQLKVRINRVESIGKARQKRLVAYISDQSGVAQLVWFRGVKWFEKRLQQGQEYIVFGRPSFYNNELSIVHPELEPISDYHESPKLGVQGVYSTTERLSSLQLGAKGLYNLVVNLWGNAKGAVTETLPQAIMEQNNLISLHDALQNIHFPKSRTMLERAQYRLKFEELFGVQLGVLEQRAGRVERQDGFIFNTVGDSFNTFFYDHLPFELTGAQKRVIREIRGDTVTGHQMNRLLQGDVGSGKTLVALMSMLLSKDNGYQSCMMAPTEILARQHHASITKMLGDMDVRVEVLTGSSTAKERREIDEGLLDGSIDIIVGTHALIEDRVQFDNLGFVVIDEQHRFGVEQRAKLWTKNQQPPHILVMTATPIPRTLAMTLYGDLDVSIIDELPPGRKPIKTVHTKDSHRLSVMGLMKREIAKGRQIYVVYPLILESEKLDYRALEEGFESISDEFPPPDYFVTVVHGKLKAEVKQENMDQFKDGVADIMVATSVIEVGVDVPNATVMVIESAERFGLSQLHQLRGRIGRGGEQSYCVLMSGDKLSRDAKARLNAMVQTNDGFELSELDLRLRGAGDIAGTQQSGVAFNLKLANLSRDTQLVAHTRDVAMAIYEGKTPISEGDKRLLEELKGRYFTKKDMDFSMIS